MHQPAAYGTSYAHTRPTSPKLCSTKPGAAAGCPKTFGPLLSLHHRFRATSSRQRPLGSKGICLCGCLHSTYIFSCSSSIFVVALGGAPLQHWRIPCSVTLSSHGSCNSSTCICRTWHLPSRSHRFDTCMLSGPLDYTLLLCMSYRPMGFFWPRRDFYVRSQTNPSSGSCLCM